MPQEESHMLFLEGQKREFSATCHDSCAACLFSELRRPCSKSNSISVEISQHLETPAAFLNHETYPYTNDH